MVIIHKYVSFSDCCPIEKSLRYYFVLIDDVSNNIRRYWFFFPLLYPFRMEAIGIWWVDEMSTR